MNQEVWCANIVCLTTTCLCINQNAHDACDFIVERKKIRVKCHYVHWKW